MSEVPEVSIIVTAYNEELYLERCVESLLAQSSKSIEIIIVDDGSTDETRLIVRTLATRDGRVKAIHQRNRGLSAARNAGLEVARGEYVCFVDGDDWVDPDMVERMVAESRRSNSQVVVAGMHVDYHDGSDNLVRSERRLPPPLEISRGVPLSAGAVDDSLVNLLGYAWNKIYSREWLLRLDIVFEEGLSLIEDIDFNARVMVGANKVVLFPEAFIHYVQRPRQTLGTIRDETFLAKRKRAIEAQDSLLKAWGVDEGMRKKRKVRASELALWQALRSAMSQRVPGQYLQRLVEQPGGMELVQDAGGGNSRRWRTVWAISALRRQRYGVALWPMRPILLAGRLVKRLPRSTKLLPAVES